MADAFDAGFDVADAFDAGFDAADAFDAGFDAADAFDAGSAFEAADAPLPIIRAAISLALAFFLGALAFFSAGFFGIFEARV